MLVASDTSLISSSSSIFLPLSVHVWHPRCARWRLSGAADQNTRPPRMAAAR